MGTAAPSPGKSVSVTIIGLVTVFWGVAEGIVGGTLFFRGAAISDDPRGGWGPVFDLMWILLALLGVAVLLHGVLMVVGGLGVLRRKRWGRVLTFIMATLAILWGLVSLAAGDKSVGSICYGGAQLLYGILAIAILFRKGAEFSRR
jgi:hypothetical protein